MNFDTKIAVVVREDLEVWQKLNVTAFTISGIAGTQEVMGKEYEDGSSRKYLPMIMQPILIFSAGRDEIRTVYAKAVSRDTSSSMKRRTGLSNTTKTPIRH